MRVCRVPRRPFRVHAEADPGAFPELPASAHQQGGVLARGRPRHLQVRALERETLAKDGAPPPRQVRRLHQGPLLRQTPENHQRSRPFPLPLICALLVLTHYTYRPPGQSAPPVGRGLRGGRAGRRGAGQRGGGGAGAAARLGTFSKREWIDEDYEGGDGSITVFAGTGPEKGRIGQLLKDRRLIKRKVHGGEIDSQQQNPTAIGCQPTLALSFI